MKSLCKSISTNRFRQGCRLLPVLVFVATSAAAQDNAPLRDPNAEQLRYLLTHSAPSTTRSFTATRPPSTDGLCEGAGATAASPARPAPSRRLVVVPYAGENTPRVDLAIEFATGSDEISALGQTVLSRLAKVLQETDLIGARFAVAGHTDRTGSDALNLELSCARAIAARRFLISQGVGHERLAAYGFGSSKPLDANAYESQSNRRVEFRRAE